jgi:osmotically-inducible protein OsmY
MPIYTPLRTAIAACALFVVCAAPVAKAHAQDQSHTTSSAAPDDTARNKNHDTTADQQRQDKSDVQITADIRRSIMDDKSLSTYAHNVKIITRNGAVTLRGPVHSDEEKQTILSKAAEVVGGQDKVTDRLTVKH